ncbi:lutropin-choriogonadotropic hormone receptor isoform X2 [Episyrphus balteatus]|uniref:lutropin-choriogonadotropic hormone receptor isoform X2 n=1 Tax=Episyrphus balteatus TaxID=286459 RepID=UPI0024853806|nr:lutropin-choriogonadotropic hormone receptor isoform X2 [Episyrphus balteatus]
MYTAILKPNSVPMMYEEQISYLHIQLKNNLTGYFLICLILFPVFSAQLSSDVGQFNKTQSNTSKKAIKQNTTESGLATFIQYKPQAVSGWECNCWNATHEFKVELECKCSGESLIKIPQKLYSSMERLTIASAGLIMLRSAGLKVYASSFRDLILTDLQHFYCIQDQAFEPLKVLRTIYIAYAPKLTFISKDAFKGISDTIKILKILHSGLVSIPDMQYLPKNAILQIIDLTGNKIERIFRKSIFIKTEQLILDNNTLTFIEDSAFSGSEIAKLSFSGNRMLVTISPTAFDGIMNIQELDLSGTSLSGLPSHGLNNLEILRIQNTESLRTIPSIYNFQNLQEAWLTHSFHCCAFQFPSTHDPIRHAQNLLEIKRRQMTCTNKLKKHSKQRRSTFNKKHKKEMFSFEKRSIEIGTESSITTLDHFSGEQIQSKDNHGAAEVDFGEFHQTADIFPGSQIEAYCGNVNMPKNNMSCFPLPNALNPCEDVMGSDWLRFSVWIVVSFAVIGNVAVLVVILCTRSEHISVQKFLISHLAFADLCMGLYLFFIASIDAHSMGEYFNYAYDWQYGAGCKIAGFLTVFASHLSVYALTIITIERWLAITNALYLNKRIKVKPAVYIMTAGWIYSLIMSSFPLFGVSNYSSTSICLPMDARNASDIIYLVSMIGINGITFSIIAVCYAQIYFSLGHETRHGGRVTEMSIAKKMSLLVFTNFACWAPIAFFGLTALAGYPLIDVTKSKILLVFFYPLNSCADPYLYAILTSQYRKDLYVLLSKLGLSKIRLVGQRDSDTLPTKNTYHITTFKGRSSIISNTDAVQETILMIETNTEA